MTQDDLDAAAEYLALVEQMLEGGDVFAAGIGYQTRFQNETRRLSEPLFLLLDKTFGDIEVATDNESLILSRPGMYISRESLLTLLRQSADKLGRIVKQGSAPGGLL